MPESTNITNDNFLSPLNFKFSIKRAPSVNFFIQEVNIPDITANSPKMPTPLVSIPQVPDQMTYGDLYFSFKVDEAMQNYFEIYKWITALASPENMDGYSILAANPEWTGEGLQSDISVFVLNSSKETIYEVVYKDAFPIKLTGFKFNTVDTSIKYVSATSIFKYTTFDIKPYK